MNSSHCRVAIIGGGPSGLALASELAAKGIGDVVVLEREATAGGIPRHCGHSPFGFCEFRRMLSGPEYARRLVASAQQSGVSLRTGVSVTRLDPGGRLTLSTADGMESLQADKVVLCTGNRETARAPRMVSGSRPLGITTTGALQALVYLKQRLPFRRPLIVGSELVSFSALLTCRHAGIRPIAMVESRADVTAWRAAALLPPLLGTRLLLNTSLEAIHGRERVEAVDLRCREGELTRLDCDGVIFSGMFVAESSLVKASHLEMNACSGGPRVDQFGRCSDPDFYACGNLLHPVDTAGWCWAEGRTTAVNVADSLNGRLDASPQSLMIQSDSDAIRYLTPQVIALPVGNSANALAPSHRQLQIRLALDSTGRLSLTDGQVELSARHIRARRERRVLLPLPSLESLDKCQSLSLQFQPDRSR
jgi:NADPH-dependent 2,4-dienoyl-CoA reductase/sulfur reductase-like enzyme